jgi:salicylate biosynthesis isochorismate synthase
MALVRTASPQAPETDAFPLSRARFLFSHPAGGTRFAAWGEAERCDTLPHDATATWVGALAFGAAAAPEWTGFSPHRFIRPERIARIEGPLALGTIPEARLVRRQGEREAWAARVDRALRAIDRGELDKVVLARAIDVEALDALPPEALLSALETRYPSCRSFLVRSEDGAAFIGASPEMLCRIEGDVVESEALAGSAAPSHSAALLRSVKDLREHRTVVEHIVRGLAAVASDVEHDPQPELRTLANVAHLRTPVSGRLLPGRTVADVVRALQPTPAVAGAPVASALRFIAEHEGFDRGLYAGLVGWVAPGRAELAVALRSALVRGRAARLFVGAGIVAGSSADREFEETELKARALLDALGVAP